MDKATLIHVLDESPKDRQETTEAVKQLLEEHYGGIPPSLQALPESRGDLFNALALSLLRRSAHLDAKTVELVALSAAVALRDEQGFQWHAGRALGLGCTHEQVLDAVVIATSVTERSVQSVAFRRHAQLSETPLPEVRPPTPLETGRRRPGRPPTFRDRQTFWDSVVQEFKQRMPRATVSGSGHPRIRSVRLGRGQEARLNWTFRRREFCIQLVLNSANPAANEERMRALEAEQSTLEKETGSRLVFESGRGRQARVSAYYKGSSRLNEAMRDWAVDGMVRMYAAFRPRLQPAKK